MKRIIVCILTQFLLIGMLIVTVYFAGVKIGQTKNSEPVAVKEAVRTIAVVNMDQGIEAQNQIVNYGTQLVSFTKDYFTSTSLEDARTGVEKGKFAAYIVIPSTFSKSVWSINTSPEKSVLDYAVNPNLSETVLADVIYDLKAFEMKLNTDISYLYLHAILEEFHSGQDSAITVMFNDRIDKEQLAAIIPEELLQPLAFVELNVISSYPEDIKLDDSYAVITSAADGMGEQFDTYITWAEEDLKELREDKEPFVEGMENMRIAVASLTFLENEQGNPAYAEGRNDLQEGLEQYDDALVEERNKLSEAFRFIGRRDVLASDSNATPENNTWLDEIQQEQNRQKEAYEEELELWLEQFDYTKLATASNATPPNADPPEATPPNADPPEATPPNATPPNATPPNATPPNSEGWLVERDTDVVMASLTGIYGKIMTDMEDLCLNEEDMEAIMEVLRRNLQEEAVIREEVASASNAYPIEIRPSPEAEAYVKEFFDRRPRQRGSITEIVDDIGIRMLAFGQDQIDYLTYRERVPILWFERVFEENIVRQIEKQEDITQETIRKELDSLDEVFRTYEDKLDRYDPLSKTDEGRLKSLNGEIGEGVKLMENLINGKSNQDRDLMRLLEENMDINIQALQDSIDQSYEGTGQNVLQVLEEAKKNRADLNEDNEKQLSSFAKKLPYTKNGSVADTSTYDFMVNPVESKEKKLVGRYQKISVSSLGSGGVVLGILVLLVAMFLLQSSTRRGKRRREIEDSEKG